MRPRVMRICGAIIATEAMGLNVPPFNPTEWPRNARDFIAGVMMHRAVAATVLTLVES